MMISYLKCLSLIAFTSSAVMVFDDYYEHVMVDDYYEQVRAQVLAGNKDNELIDDPVIIGHGRQAAAYSIMAYMLKDCGKLKECEIVQEEYPDYMKKYISDERDKLKLLYATPMATKRELGYETDEWHSTCFLARRSDDILVIAFTGSTDGRTFWADAKYLPKKEEFPVCGESESCPPGNSTFEVHTGFFDSWKDCWHGPKGGDGGLEKKLAEEIKKDPSEPPRIVIAGHSLGGAQASIAAVQVALAFRAKVRLLTQGAPRPFLNWQNEKDSSAHRVQDQLVDDTRPSMKATLWPKPGNVFVRRWVNEGDPAPGLPGSWQHYSHFGRAILIKKKKKDYTFEMKGLLDYSPWHCRTLKNMIPDVSRHIIVSYMARLSRDGEAIEDDGLEGAACSLKKTDDYSVMFNPQNESNTPTPDTAECKKSTDRDCKAFRSKYLSFRPNANKRSCNAINAICSGFLNRECTCGKAKCFRGGVCDEPLDADTSKA